VVRVGVRDEVTKGVGLHAETAAHFAAMYVGPMYVQVYVCMYTIFIKCDRRTSNNKHKKAKTE